MHAKRETKLEMLPLRVISGYIFREYLLIKVGHHEIYLLIISALISPINS
jgi:hypothetical protein